MELEWHLERTIVGEDCRRLVVGTRRGVDDVGCSGQCSS